MPTDSLVSCLSCGKMSKPVNFAPEYNPKGKYYSCEYCLRNNKVYCPIHQGTHPRSEMVSAAFKIGTFCPISNTEDDFSNSVAGVLSVIASKLSSIEKFGERISNLEDSFNTMIGIMEQFASLPVSSPQNTAELSEMKSKIESLEKEIQKQNSDCERLIEENYELQEKITQYKSEADQAKAAYEAVVNERKRTVDILEEFSKKL